MWHGDHSTPTDTPPSCWRILQVSGVITECRDLPLAAVCWRLSRDHCVHVNQCPVPGPGGGGCHGDSDGKYHGVCHHYGESQPTDCVHFVPRISINVYFSVIFSLPAARWQAGLGARTGGELPTHQAGCQHFKQSEVTPAAEKQIQREIMVLSADIIPAHDMMVEWSDSLLSTQLLILKIQFITYSPSPQHSKYSAQFVLYNNKILRASYTSCRNVDRSNQRVASLFFSFI